jgi:hypothetical protein
MESLFGKKKEAKPQGEAMDTIMGNKPTMGGPGGTLSTADLVKARAAFDAYAIDKDSSGGGDRLTFEEFVQQVWKPGQK